MGLIPKEPVMVDFPYQTTIAPFVPQDSRFAPGES